MKNDDNIRRSTTNYLRPNERQTAVHISQLGYMKPAPTDALVAVGKPTDEQNHWKRQFPVVLKPTQAVLATVRLHICV